MFRFLIRQGTKISVIIISFVPILSVYCQVRGEVLWKRLTAESSHHGNASKKWTHKNNLMSSSLNLKLKNYILTIFTVMAAAPGPLACPSRSARPP